uniref:Uncharacterized protein n=1 Tax=Rhizophora mucronata TaxID=61149 RepID=A0A2P2QZP6_RHIMU
MCEIKCTNGGGCYMQVLAIFLTSLLLHFNVGFILSKS